MNEPDHSFLPLPECRGRWPFRLGVTSYVYPADVITNVRALAGKVDDVELVFFESPDATNVPSTAELAELRAIAAANGLTYTVHFPTDHKLGAPSVDECKAALEQILKIARLTRPLSPFAYVLHIEGISPFADRSRLRQWQEGLTRPLARIGEAVGDPSLVCVENLDFPFEWCEPLIERAGLSACLDAGHLWKKGYDPEEHVRRYLSKTRVIHLYGPAEGSRHASLRAAPAHQTRRFLKSIEGFSGVLTLETFEYDDTRTSIEVLIQRL